MTISFVSVGYVQTSPFADVTVEGDLEVTMEISDTLEVTMEVD